jgi:hypothetical protein
MGYETKCRTRVTGTDGKVREADSTVLLETDELIVRGEARIKIPRADIAQVTTRGGTLTIKTPVGTVTMTLTPDMAAKWAKKIQEPPKRLIDKLDVKPDAKVWLFGVDDETLIAQVGERTSHALTGTSAAACDVVFVGVETDEQLSRIERALKATNEDGSIWVVHRKGPSGIADTTIFAKAKELGLTYTKVARVSETHTAEKLVRPLATRKKSATRRSS